MGKHQEKSSPSLSGLRRPFGNSLYPEGFLFVGPESLSIGTSGHQEADPAMTIGRRSGEGRPDYPSVEERIEVITKGAPVLGGNAGARNTSSNPGTGTGGNEPGGVPCGFRLPMIGNRSFESPVLESKKGGYHAEGKD